ncbi:MAG: glycosyltransferase [Actinobacteria bacterium]|nr:glycosyltransferase [Actinomycetota bacterium]MBW3649001.1 glycosyltransferase [Actinomycetota bacterium]
MRSLAVLSMHTSPLAQPGTGDGGGMNVYVRELATALARAGVRCDVYTRSWSPHLDPVVAVEPGLHVHHVVAGPESPVPKEDLPELVAPFTRCVLTRMRGGHPADAIHANYWLSGLAGHTLKHELDLPLVSTFHTLDRVKAEVDLSENGQRRSQAESDVIGCSDAILASCEDEVTQLVRLYGADADRIEVVPLGVDHAFFAPNPASAHDSGRAPRGQARRAVGLPEDQPILLFVGRIQPLKGLEVAVRALAELAGRVPEALLVVVGGPSGVDGEAEVERVQDLVVRLGLAPQVRFFAPQPHELLSTFYRAADVCVVPSRSESFGLVALEAAACGTPVVASAVGGLTSLVRNGETGLLIDSRRPGDFADAIAQVLADDDLAWRLGRRAAEHARGYTWTVAAARLRRLYAKLTARQLVECS